MSARAAQHSNYLREYYSPTESKWNLTRALVGLQGDAMCFFKRSIVAFLLISVMCCLPTAAQDHSGASIQEQTPNAPTPQKTTIASDDGWHFAVTPYLWFAGASGRVGALGHNAGVHASAGDLLSHFDIGLMGLVEARKNRFVLPVDFLWIKLRADKALPFDQGLNSIQVKATQTILTPKAGYRIVDGKKIKIDALAGFRYWHLGQTLNFQPQLFNGFSRSANWVDAVAGGKMEVPLSEKALISIAADAGGGGADLDYQTVGALGYQLGKKAILQLGYRYLYVNYHTNPPVLFVYDLHTSGALLGITFNLK